jgi:hypothetical protein
MRIADRSQDDEISESQGVNWIGGMGNVLRRDDTDDD